jgi:capsular exopolysaccharide synthesis family protein
LRDAVKTLRANIQFSSIDEEIKTLVVTSTQPQEGKTTLSIYLGIAMAEYGKKTLLVECDNRRPMIGTYLSKRGKVTIADVIANKGITAQSAVEHSSIQRLDYLDSIVMVNPVEVLSSKKFWSIIEELKDEYDIIILDTPPLGSFIEAAVLAAKADGTLLVMRAGKVDVADAKKVVEQLEKAKARVLGVALNGVDMSNESYYSDYYYSGGERKRRKGGNKIPKGTRVQGDLSAETPAAKEGKPETRHQTEPGAEAQRAPERRGNEPAAKVKQAKRMEAAEEFATGEMPMSRGATERVAERSATTAVKNRIGAQVTRESDFVREPITGRPVPRK